ncbi:Aquaporin [Plakobranchus ocellatus]|uniref:Aquaporin n=1 Tax=Plakobranchus ocellatus TaxID=259542 RepID=A0AAV3Y4L0_9GAST|nr:Aquaporin [Plakobranchus ocellatus]
MSAQKKFPQPNATQVNPGRAVASPLPSSLSQPVPPPASRGTRLPGSDNRQRQASVPQPAPPLYHYQPHHFTPSLRRRDSGQSETSSLASASAEFDGDISIVAPLGQEEDTDLYSVHSLSTQSANTSPECKLLFAEAETNPRPTNRNKFKKEKLLNPGISQTSFAEESQHRELLPSPTISIKHFLNTESLPPTDLQQKTYQKQKQLQQQQDKEFQNGARDIEEDITSDTTNLLQTYQQQPLQHQRTRLYQRSQLKSSPSRRRKFQQQQRQHKQAPIPSHRSTQISKQQQQDHQNLKQQTKSTGANHSESKQEIEVKHHHHPSSGGRTPSVQTFTTSPPRSCSSTPSACPPRMATSLEDITSLRLWKGIIAEFVGTLLLTLVGCGSCINLRGDDNKTSPVVQIALCFGLSVATVVWAIAHVSGGHVNPAVTCAMLAARKVSLAKAVFFIVFQLVGAVVGAGLLYGLTPHEYRGNLGCTLVSDRITPAQGFGVELFVTFVLVFTVFASCDGKRKDLNGSAPLTIGLSVTMCHLWAGNNLRKTQGNFPTIGAVHLDVSVFLSVCHAIIEIELSGSDLILLNAHQPALSSLRSHILSESVTASGRSLPSE